MQLGKVKKRTCPHCGAPLQLTKGVSDITCQYCGTAVHVEWTRQRPPREKAKPDTVYASPGMGVGTGLLVALFSLAPVVVSLVMFAGPALGDLAVRFGVSKLVFPVSCGVNEAVQIVGITHHGTGTLITADVNCRLLIRDSQLSADVVVDAKNLANITIENSTIEGADVAIQAGMNTRIAAGAGSVLRGREAAVEASHNLQLSLEGASLEAEEAGLKSGVNAKLKLSKKSKIAGKEVGVDGDTNCEIELDDSIIEGGERGLLAGVNAKVRLEDGAKLKGGRSALEARTNLDLSLRNASIESGGVAVCGEHNAEIRARGSVIRAPEALRLRREPKVFELEGTELSGRKLFSASGCSAGS